MYLTRRDSKVVENKSTNTQNFGGYIMYFKLFSKFIEQYKIHKSLMKWYQRIWCLISMVLQMIFKPLKQFYSYKNIILCKYRTSNETSFILSYKRITYYRLFGVTLFHTTNDNINSAEANAHVLTLLNK